MAAAVPGRLVMFDEPTSDVDAARRRLLWRQIRALADGGCAVVVVTHNMIEAERSLDRLVVLDQGRVLAEGTPAGLCAVHGDRVRLELVAVDEISAWRLAGEFAAGWHAVPVVSGRRVVAQVAPARVAAALGWARGWRDSGRVEEFWVTPTSLEDVYLALVGGSAEEAWDASLVA
jgi:ABC-2 type transport system ATP-binding protein